MGKKSQPEQHPAQKSGSTKRWITRKIEQAPSEQGRTGDLKKGRERAMLTARGFWKQQGGKAATGEAVADNKKPH